METSLKFIVAILSGLTFLVTSCKTTYHSVYQGKVKRSAYNKHNYPIPVEVIGRYELFHEFVKKHEKECDKFGVIIHEYGVHKAVFTFYANYPNLKEKDEHCSTRLGLNNPYFYTEIDGKKFYINTVVERYFRPFKGKTIVFRFPCENWCESYVDSAGYIYKDTKYRTDYWLFTEQHPSKVKFIPPKELEETGKVVPEESNDW